SGLRGRGLGGRGLRGRGLRGRGLRGHELRPISLVRRDSGRRKAGHPESLLHSREAPPVTERPNELHSWGTKTLDALNDAMDKLVRQRQRSDGISTADPRSQDWFDLSHIDPSTPGRFPGVGDSGRHAEPTLRDQPVEGQVRGPSTSSGHLPGAEPVEAQDGTRAEPVVAHSEPAEPVKSLEELLAELDALIGLADVKAEIHRQVAI